MFSASQPTFRAFSPPTTLHLPRRSKLDLAIRSTRMPAMQVEIYPWCTAQTKPCQLAPQGAGITGRTKHFYRFVNRKSIS